MARTSTTPVDEGRWQFSLRGMLLLTTVAAVSAAIAAARGIGSLLLSLGVTLTAFNSAGYLRHLQTARWRPRWVYLGWLVFLTSMFLPAARGCGNSTSAGWEVAWICGASQVDAVVKLATQEDERDNLARQVAQAPMQTLLPHVYLLVLNVSNVVMLLSPAAWLLWRQDRGRILLGVLVVGASCGWSITWSSDDASKMEYGYYVWCAAMMLVLTAQRIPWRQAIISWCLLAAWLLRF